MCDITLYLEIIRLFIGIFNKLIMVEIRNLLLLILFLKEKLKKEEENPFLLLFERKKYNKIERNIENS